MNKNYNKDESAQVGIGTMIVFIATILVAAVAAGVLIDTSQKLQDKSSRTGNDAVSNVGTAFTVLNVWGDDLDDGAGGAADGLLDQLYLDIQLSSGADPVDLGNVAITYNDGGALIVYTAADPVDTAETTDDEFWIASVVRDGDSSLASDVINKDDIVRIGLGRNSDGATGFSLDELGTDTEVTVTLATPNGSPVSVSFTTPANIDTDAYLRLY